MDGDDRLSLGDTPLKDKVKKDVTEKIRPRDFKQRPRGVLFCHRRFHTHVCTLEMCFFTFLAFVRLALTACLTLRKRASLLNQCYLVQKEDTVQDHHLISVTVLPVFTVRLSHFIT